ncbi:MAG: nucleotidyl transferase AbiEii/AbiGii toxin family protein [Bacilli bacterium]|jgi:predicted nucleotidyltransferase component of viral defense system|nr:nucleotidyl transferase AbiEii/AbiGii toxin family protein [Bacilli bacterium]
MNNILDELVSDYKPGTLDETKSALREIAQSIVLVGLSKGDFFKKASFYGGTALRLFYGLDRFSEDLDFTLRRPDPSFSLQPFFPFVEDAAASYGIHMSIERKPKVIASPVESAFGKLKTYETFLALSVPSSWPNRLHRDEKIKVEFEVDKKPALGFAEESKWLPRPEFAPISVLDAPSLFAGKLHAVLSRKYKMTVKGRDYYDFLFFIGKGISPNLEYLRNRLVDSYAIGKNDVFDLSTLKRMLHERFAAVDFKAAVKDASRFVESPQKFGVWSREMFDSLAEQIK